jgi:hypothetical protein
MLRTELRTFKLRELTQLGAEVGQKNARSMPPATYKRLVDNIRRDGVLTSTPLVGRMEGKDDRLFVLSGNHRVAAAMDAGIEEAACITILDPIPRDRFSAIQLSHNAIEGEDDASILQELYGILDLDLKAYSGLTDDDFEKEDLSVLTLAANQPLYIEVVFGFLADDARAVEEFLKSAGRWQKKKTPAYLASYAEFERFFDALVRAKELKGITNSAIAVSALVDLANERMDQIEAKVNDNGR